MFKLTVRDELVGAYSSEDDAATVLGRMLIKDRTIGWKWSVEEVTEPVHEWAERISKGFTSETGAQWVLEQIEQNLWSGSAEDVRAAIAKVLNSYFIALEG
jgi:hypothetical protein